MTAPTNRKSSQHESFPPLNTHGKRRRKNAGRNYGTANRVSEQTKSMNWQANSPSSPNHSHAFAASSSSSKPTSITDEETKETQKMQSKVFEIFTGILPSDGETTATEILNQDDQAILNWMRDQLCKELEEQDPLQDPAVKMKVEELQSKIAELESLNKKNTEDNQGLSTLTEELKSILKRKESTLKDFEDKIKSTKVLIIRMAAELAKLRPNAESTVGTMTKELVNGIISNMISHVEELEKLYNIQSNRALEASSTPHDKEKADKEKTQKTVKAIQEKVAALEVNVCTEIKKIANAQDHEIQGILENLSTYAGKMLELCDEAVIASTMIDSELEPRQEQIANGYIAELSEDVRKALATVQSWNNEEQIKKDIKAHKEEHEKNIAALKDMLMRSSETYSKFQDMKHQIHTALLSDKMKKNEDMAKALESQLEEVSKKLVLLPIEINKITEPSIREDLIMIVLDQINEGLYMCGKLARDMRKDLEGKSAPTEEHLKNMHMTKLKSRFAAQKAHIIELDKRWEQIRPYVLARITELTTEVEVGQSKEIIPEQALKRIAICRGIDPKDIVDNEIVPFEMRHFERSNKLTELKKKFDKVYESAELAKKEANRTHDAHERGGKYTTETWWNQFGYREEKVELCFNPQAPLTSSANSDNAEAASSS